MRQNPQETAETADLVKLTYENLHGKLNFLFSNYCFESLIYYVKFFEQNNRSSGTTPFYRGLILGLILFNLSMNDVFRGW